MRAALTPLAYRNEALARAAIAPMGAVGPVRAPAMRSAAPAAVSMGTGGPVRAPAATSTFDPADPDGLLDPNGPLGPFQDVTPFGSDDEELMEH